MVLASTLPDKLILAPVYIAPVLPKLTAAMLPTVIVDAVEYDARIVLANTLPVTFRLAPEIAPTTDSVPKVVA